MALTDKQAVFVDEYLKCRNAAEAARRAGYSERTARSIGAENLTKPDIAEEIRIRTEEMAMGKDELLARLGDMARGSMEDFISFNEAPYPTFVLDLDKARRRNKLHLIKKIEYDKDGNPKIELYSALDAEKTIAQMINGAPTGSEKDPIHFKMDITDWRKQAEERRKQAGEIMQKFDD